MTRRTALLVIPAVITLLVLGAAPAHADPMQDRIDDVIAEFGGEQTAYNEVMWGGGAVILTLADDFSTFAIGSCADGNFCAYSAAGYLGSRLTFTTCVANQSTAALGAVRSVANARSIGTVTAYNGTTPLFSVFANSGTNTTATVTKLSCS